MTAPNLQSLLSLPSEQSDSKPCSRTLEPRFMLNVFCIHWLTSIAIFVAAFILTFDPPDEAIPWAESCNLYFIIVYLKLGFWIGTYQAHGLIKPPCIALQLANKPMHDELVRCRDRPLQIVSIFCTVLILVQKYTTQILNVDNKHANDVCKTAGGPPQIILVIFSGLEAITLTIFYVPTLCTLFQNARVGFPYKKRNAMADEWLRRAEEQPLLQSDNSEACFTGHQEEMNRRASFSASTQPPPPWESAEASSSSTSIGNIRPICSELAEITTLPFQPGQRVSTPATKLSAAEIRTRLLIQADEMQMFLQLNAQLMREAKKLGIDGNAAASDTASGN